MILCLERGALLLILSLLLLLCGGRESCAQDALIEELVVTNSSSELLVFATLKNAFGRQMEEGIKHGIPVTFNFSLELSRKRRGWFNQKLVALEFFHTMGYDTLKEEYTLIRSESPGPVSRFKSLAEAKNAVNRLNGVAVLPLSRLREEDEYLLRLKARLAGRSLPFAMHQMIPFWSLGDFETEWKSVEFRY